jgi:eukaryotic-like serine/threonine-protein kinase
VSFTTGTKLGHYEILSPLGSGGMGEVYRARDTKLGREVALKFLPDAFARDADRMERFTREAQTLAALNQSNIAAIYGIEESESKRALVLELVEGETLSDRLAHGAIPIVEAAKMALQISEALDAAHEKGIVHCDLKPANIKITPQGVVKVLDFGLARVLLTDQLKGLNPSDYPTLSGDESHFGMIFGSAGYMAPEQARGKIPDRRADIWAFGAVLYEMLSGRRAFPGETISDSLVKILEKDPDWQQLPAQTPIALRRLLRSCLKKNLRERLQSIGDARNTLQELLADPLAFVVNNEVQTTPAWKRVLPWILVPLAFVVGFLFRPSPKPASSASERLEISLPAGENLAHNYREGVAISHDGKRVAFVAKPGLTGDPQKARIYIRAIDQWDAVPVPGTEGGFNPFFSSDDQWLGFVSRSAQKTQILKAPLSGGGSPVVVGETNPLVFGITWGADGPFVYSDQLNGGLKILSNPGAPPTDFTQLDTAANQVSHRLPHFLPDGSAVLYTVLRFKYVTPDWSKAQIWVKSLKTGDQKLLIEDGTDAQYVGDGWIVFARLGKLFAIAFDEKSLSVQGQPIQVLDGITHATYEVGATSTTGAAQFSVSDDGTLVYVEGGIEPPVLSSLVWADRSGKTSLVGTPARAHLSARVSPDGKQIVFNEYYQNADLWVYDLTRGVLTRETFGGQNAFPIWTPDGNAITFRSDRTGPTAIYQKKLSSDEIVQLTSGPNDTPSAWSPDGRDLAFIRPRAGGNGTNNVSNIFILSAGKSIAQPLQDSQFDQMHPDFSPNGKWIAYDSTESTPKQVYVQGYPDGGERVQISTDGGTDPAFSRDGKELFYIKGSSMMSVHYREAGGHFVPEKPVVLFDGMLSRTNSRGYDVAPDGRFLFPKAENEQSEERLKRIFPSTIRIILNWRDELRSR